VRKWKSDRNRECGRETGTWNAEEGHGMGKRNSNRNMEWGRGTATGSLQFSKESDYFNRSLSP
jgi:hypothetical protein